MAHDSTAHGSSGTNAKRAFSTYDCDNLHFDARRVQDKDSTEVGPKRRCLVAPQCNEDTLSDSSSTRLHLINNIASVSDMTQMAARTLASERVAIRLLRYRPNALEANQRMLFLPVSLPQEEMVSTLCYPVHPVFRPRNWEKENIYEAIIPALRLASLFLTHESISKFGHRTCFGLLERQIDPHSGEAMTRVYDSYKGSQQDCREAFAATLQAMAPEMAYKFVKLNQVYGTHQPTLTPVTIKSCNVYKTFQHVQLCQDFETTAMRVYSRGREIRLRFYFNLAVTLVHELAHAVESRKGFVGDPEALHQNDIWKEAGKKWASMVFGGRVGTFGTNLDGSAGIFLDSPYPNCSSRENVDMKRIWYVQQHWAWENPTSNPMQVLTERYPGILWTEEMDVD